MRYFKLDEFTCKCGCGLNNMDIKLLEMLDEARHLSGVPFVINCGCRCNKHNKEVGGVKDSSHLLGLAVDISARSDFQKFKIIGALYLVGFRRILLYDSFIHVDIDLSKVNPILKIMR